METKNLSKDNFWNELYEKCHGGPVQVFCEWIDEYKKKMDWNSLFPITERKNHWMDIKFHHLPLAMQVGIIMQFYHETKSQWRYELELTPTPGNWASEIYEWFMEEHKLILEEKALNPAP